MLGDLYFNHLTMAAGQQYRATFGFVSTGEGILSFKVGEQFTLVSKTDEHWWRVRSPSGEQGLAPISYLEACPVSPLPTYCVCVCMYVCVGVEQAMEYRHSLGRI